MMLVVADGSPFIALIQISRLELLPSLFREVIIPPEVLTELASPKRPDGVRAIASALPPWLLVRAPSTVAPILGLHAGETAAIHLAHEIEADMLLIDEAKGRRVAVQRGLRVTGTLGILETAALAGMLDLGHEFEKLKAAGFWVSRGLLEDILRRLPRERH